jgi:HEPN domain-containing protein
MKRSLNEECGLRENGRGQPTALPACRQVGFLLAAERLRSADVLHAQIGSTYAVIELLQESIERYLKGFLIAKGWSLQRIHDLAFLNDEAKKVDARFERFDDLCERLTEQFWAQHYPGGDLSTVGTEFEDMRRQAGEMVSTIQRLMPQFFQDVLPE